MSRPEWRDAEKERRWRRLLHQWRRSGLTGRDFCSQNFLSEPSFYAWKREISKRDLEKRTAAQATARVSVKTGRSVAVASPAFLPVRVDAVASGAALEVVTAGGHVLRVRTGFDAELLRRLLEVLEEPSC
jgi:hypothetical protein